VTFTIHAPSKISILSRLPIGFISTYLINAGHAKLALSISPLPKMVVRSKKHHTTLSRLAIIISGDEESSLSIILG
jgi:hypothetical protein